MKLELKHLAPYLPYGLEVIACRVQNTQFVLEKMNQTKAYGYTKYGNFIPIGDLISEIKPILRPLSDLTKEIEINGEKFVPIDKIHRIDSKVYIYKPTNYDLEITIDTEDFSHEVDLYDGYLIMQKLFEYHFDVFGLIDKNLAIDINTLK